MSNWFGRARQDWIAEMVDIYGFIRRRHICSKFGITPIQASHDLQWFIKQNPGAVVYDNRRRAYISTNPEAKILSTDNF